MPAINTTYGDAAKAAYAAFEPVFLAHVGTNSDDYPYWQMGHAFDTIIDFFEQIDSTRGAYVLGQVQSRYGSYFSHHEPIRYWYDDYGWWGIAAAKAGQSWVSAQAQPYFKELAKTNWGDMNQNALSGWDARRDRQITDAFAPYFANGAWNHVLDKADNPGVPGLAGRQNTVTNGLYTVLSSRLALARLIPGDRANEAYGFLDSWASFDQDGDRCLILTRGVVRERIGMFKNPNAKDVDYDPKLAWAGDQGLILGVLLDRVAMKSGDTFGGQSPFDAASDVLRGVVPYLGDPNTKMLLPWARSAGQKGNAPGNDDFDYKTGPGVFFRYLLGVQNQSVLLKKVQQSQSLQQMLQANANAAFPFLKSDLDQGTRPLADRVNDLAALVAAAMLVR